MGLLESIPSFASLPATCFRPWSALWPPLDVVRGRREPISQAQYDCNQVSGFISSTVPATGPQGAGHQRPAQVLSFYAGDSMIWRWSFGLQVSRPSPLDCAPISP
jgi:hypothetical protein